MEQSSERKGSVRRVRRGVDEWRGLVAEQASSGLSGLAWCRRHGVKYGSFSIWRRRLSARRAVDWLELPLSEVEVAQGCVVRLGNGAVIECAALPSPVWLSEVLRACSR
jgi:hypothetical protein